jgi:type II secretory pathway pseudopilin PulG
VNIGRNELLVGVAILVVAVLIVVPIFVSSNKSSQLDELAQNVEAIRQAELQYNEAFGGYVSADAAPRAAHQVDGNPVPWTPTEGFRKLSWAPATPTVLGSYTIQADRTGFTVIGTCDIDGDGRRAVVQATHGEAARVVSEEGVY